MMKSELDYIYFRCTVLSHGGHQPEKLLLTVRSEQEIYDYLERRNFTPIKIQRIRWQFLYLLHQKFANRVISQTEIIQLCDYLSHVLKSGITFLDGLEEFVLHHRSMALKQIINNIIYDLKNGYKISDSFRKYPDLFDQTFTGLIAVAEQTGKLSTIFEQLSEHLKWNQNLVQKTKQALTYPVMTFSVMMATLLFLLGYTVPQLVEFIKSLESKISLSTQLLIWIGESIQDYFIILLLMPFVLIFILIFIKSKYRQQFDRLKLKIWLFGEIYHFILLARSSYLLKLLYESGIPLLESIKLVEQSIENSVIKQKLSTIYQDISQGQSITQSFLKVQFFSPLLNPILKMGENTGELDQSLKAIHEYYSQQVEHQMGKIYTLAQPSLTVFLGFILIWIISSVIAPIYDVIIKVH